MNYLQLSDFLPLSLSLFIWNLEKGKNCYLFEATGGKVAVQLFL